MTEADGAERNAPFPDKWPRASQTDIVERYHGEIRKLVAERFAAGGKAWDELVHDPASELTREDFGKIEADLLADRLPVRGLRGRLPPGGAGQVQAASAPPRTPARRTTTSRAGRSSVPATTSSRPAT